MVSRLVALILLLLMSPVLILIYLLTTLIFGKPIFSQLRIGKGESPFMIYKFRSIMMGRKHPGLFGRLLRKFSFDELPQLINIIKGEMNFVGPRPLLPEYLPLYSNEQRKRHIVKPGITGLAQVSGRNKLSWKEQFELDIFFVENNSFCLRSKIIILSFLRLLSSPNKETQIRKAFNGSN